MDIAATMDKASHVLAQGASPGMRGSSRALAGRKDVPRSTRGHRARGRPSIEEKAQSQHYLHSSEEKALVEFLLHQHALGRPVRITYLRPIAFRLACQRVPTNRPRKEPGKNWPQSFYRRHSDIKGGALDWDRYDISRKVLFWLDIMTRRVLEDPTVLQENVYNMYETRVMLSELNSVKVLVRQENQGGSRGARVKRPTVTAIECVSGDGRCLNPMIIWPASTHQANWITHPTPGWHCAYSDIGYTDSYLSLQWLKHVFDPQTRERANQKPRVLICDGFGKHETLEILWFCFDNNIILCRLPPNASHKLQPFDISLFGPLEAAYRDQVEQLERGGVATIGKEHFTTLYNTARDRAFTSKNIRAGWDKAGLFPSNTDKILDDTRKPSTGLTESHPGDRLTPNTEDGDLGWNQFTFNSQLTGTLTADISITAQRAREFSRLYKQFRRRFIIPLLKSCEPPRIRIRICLLDTGIDLKDEDLKNERRAVKQYRLEQGFENDDLDPIKQRKPCQGGSDTTIRDTCGHGTHLALLLLRYAPDADIYIAKVSSKIDFQDKNAIVKALEWATSKHIKADIITMSFGYDMTSTVIHNAIRETQKTAGATGHTPLLFAAASNHGLLKGPSFPASDTNVICVYALDGNGFDLQGLNPPTDPFNANLGTLGHAIELSWPEKVSTAVDESYVLKYKSGTSYATPILAATTANYLAWLDCHAAALGPNKLRHAREREWIVKVFRERMATKQQSRSDMMFVAPWTFFKMQGCDLAETQEPGYNLIELDRATSLRCLQVIQDFLSAVDE
ncbi:DDE-domain-containing protein [Sarocladium strictum]